MACRKFRKRVTMPRKCHKHAKNSAISSSHAMNFSHNSEVNEKDSSPLSIFNEEDFPETLSISSNEEDPLASLNNEKEDSDETPPIVSKKKR